MPIVHPDEIEDNMTIPGLDPGFKLGSLSISGYKSIKELKNFNLCPLNVLIGANGAGKSNFISFFRLLKAMYEQQLQRYVSLQGGPDALLHFGRNVTASLNAEFYFGPNSYKFSLLPSNENRFIFEQEEVFCTNFNQGSKYNPLGSGHAESKLKDVEDKLARHAKRSISNWNVYHFHDTSDSAKVKQIHPENDNLLLKSDASNLAPYLLWLNKKHPQKYKQIVETIQLVLPFFGTFIHRNNEEYVQLEWTQKGMPDMPLKAHLLSDGSLRFICLMTLLLQPIDLLPYTILIDEPELGLHPYAIAILVDVLKQVAEDRQLIIATQSVELINELSPEDVIVVDQEDGASTFRRYTQKELSGWLEEYSLGEIWNCNIIGGRP